LFEGAKAMSFRQYTQCVDVANFDPRNPYVIAALLGLYVTLPVGVLPALLAIAGVGSPWCLLLLAEVYLIAGVIGYCYWWLYRRLICLPATPDHPADSAGDHLAIGLVIDILLPNSDSNPLDIDNDYSIGILVCPNPVGSAAPVVAGSEPFGYLVTAQPVIADNNLLFTGQAQKDPLLPDLPASEILHCEFEGRAVYDMFLASRFALFPAVAAVFACQVPGIGWLITLILAVLGFLAMGVALVLGHVGSDEGNPNDVSPNIGELHQGVDTLLIKGHWVYDSGHRFDQKTGYNELHPITFCTKASCGGDVILLKERWGTAIDGATSPATLQNQKLPQNQWQIHPIIDGCQPVVIF
jgi:hypothetical protein